MKDTFEVIFDGTFSYIRKSNEDVDGLSIFENLPKAKRRIIDELREDRDGIQKAINRIRSLREEDVTHEEQI